ncbi:MAG: 30S ribosomal protein S6 [bacterium]
MREYETLYLLQPDLSTEKIEEFNNKLSEIIKSQGGNPLTVFNWGKRRLAYRVGKGNHGVYVYLNYLGQGNLVAEIERILKYDDNVLKYITVKLEDDVNVEERVKVKREFILSSIDDPSDRPPPQEGPRA